MWCNQKFKKEEEKKKWLEWPDTSQSVLEEAWNAVSRNSSWFLWNVSGSVLLVSHALPPLSFQQPHFTRRETEPRRGSVSRPKSHSQLGAERGTGQVWLQSWPLAEA